MPRNGHNEDSGDGSARNVTHATVEVEQYQVEKNGLAPIHYTTGPTVGPVGQVRTDHSPPSPARLASFPTTTSPSTSAR